jgi:hypothetical protein
MLLLFLQPVLLLLLLLFTEDNTMICRYECTPMYVEGNSLLDSGHLVSYAQLLLHVFKTPQQTGVHNIWY